LGLLFFSFLFEKGQRIKQHEIVFYAIKSGHSKNLEEEFRPFVKQNLA
jgi:hypothetical protein